MADANTALTYTWDLKSIKLQNTDSISNVVVHATWSLTGTDAANNSGTFHGAGPFAEPKSDNFIPYEKLTKSIVLSWIESDVTNNQTYMNHINERIIEQINIIKNPIIEINDNFPWSNTVSTKI